MVAEKASDTRVMSGAESIEARWQSVGKHLVFWGQADQLAAEIDKLPLAEDLRAALQLTTRYGLTPVRSALLFAACQAVGGDITEQVSRAGLALQMFGLFLHVHDDLIDQTRAISSSALPAIHVDFGYNGALVVGDILLLRSSILFTGALLSALPREEALRGIGWFERAGLEVADAQLRELGIMADLDVTPGDYLSLARSKTAEFSMCMRVGGLLGGGQEDELEALGDYGRCMGTLSVLRGDLVDVLYRRDSLQGRLRNETVPLPLLIAAERSPDAKLYLRSLQDAPEIDEERLVTILRMVSRTGALEDTMRQVMEQGSLARRALERLRTAGSLEFLEAMIDVSSSLEILSGTALPCSI